MSDNKKYYYLKLKENFFDVDATILLESMPDGYLYSNILLKLYLRSLKNDGKLMFNDCIPYNPQMIASITRHQIGTVEKALHVFEQLQLIEILNTDAIYMLDIQNYIGESSTEADRKREYRLEIEKERTKKQQLEGQMSGQMYDKNPPEIEIELENRDNIISSNDDMSSEDKTSSDDKCPHIEILKLYNRICTSLPQIKEMTESRKSTMRTWWRKDKLTLDGLKGFFEKVESSDFLTNRISDFKNCSFDWIIKAANRQKIIEGNYDNKKPHKKKDLEVMP